MLSSLKERKQKIQFLAFSFSLLLVSVRLGAVGEGNSFTFVSFSVSSLASQPPLPSHSFIFSFPSFLPPLVLHLHSSFPIPSPLFAIGLFPPSLSRHQSSLPYILALFSPRSFSFFYLVYLPLLWSVWLVLEWCLLLINFSVRQDFAIFSSSSHLFVYFMFFFFLTFLCFLLFILQFRLCLYY